jgi:hypothetical protein
MVSNSKWFGANRFSGRRVKFLSSMELVKQAVDHRNRSWPALLAIVLDILFTPCDV